MHHVPQRLLGGSTHPNAAAAKGGLTPPGHKNVECGSGGGEVAPPPTNAATPAGVNTPPANCGGGRVGSPTPGRCGGGRGGSFPLRRMRRRRGEVDPPPGHCGGGGGRSPPPDECGGAGGC